MFIDLLLFVGMVCGAVVGITAILAAIAFFAWAIGILGFNRIPAKKLLLLTYADTLAYGALNFPSRHFDPADGKVVDGPGGPGQDRHCYSPCPWIASWKSWVIYFGWLVQPVSYDQQNNPDGFGEGLYADLSDHLVKIPIVDAETKDIPDPDFPNDTTKSIAGPIVSFVAQGIGYIEDPQLFVWESPREVFQANVVDETDACLRTDARLKTEQEILVTAAGGQLGVSLQRPEVGGVVVFGVMRSRWGFRLRPETLTLKNVTFNKPYQDARQAERIAQMEARAAKARIFDPVMSVLPKKAKLTAAQAVKLRALDMGATVADLDVHSGDESINPGTLVLGGGAGAGILVGNTGKPGKNPGGKGEKSNEQKAQEFFDENREWPYWDPLKRGEKKNS